MKVTRNTRYALAKRRADRTWDKILQDLPAHPIEAHALQIVEEIDRGLGPSAYLGSDGRKQVAQALVRFGRLLLQEAWK